MPPFQSQRGRGAVEDQEGQFRLLAGQGHQVPGVGGEVPTAGTEPGAQPQAQPAAGGEPHDGAGARVREGDDIG